MGDTHTHTCGLLRQAADMCVLACDVEAGCRGSGRDAIACRRRYQITLDGRHSAEQQHLTVALGDTSGWVLSGPLNPPPPPPGTHTFTRSGEGGNPPPPGWGAS